MQPNLIRRASLWLCAVQVLRFDTADRGTERRLEDLMGSAKSLHQASAALRSASDLDDNSQLIGQSKLHARDAASREQSPVPGMASTTALGCSTIALASVP